MYGHDKLSWDLNTKILEATLKYIQAYDVLRDIVLVRQSKENKLSTRYDPKPYKVVKRRGSRVTVLRNGHYVTRNISFFKKFAGEFDDEVGSATETDYFDHDIDNGISDEGENNARYPVRNRQPVQRYGQNIYSA